MPLLTVGHDPHLVVGGVEADAGGAYVIHDYGIEVLTGQLSAAVFERAIPVLGGEAHEHLAGTTAGGKSGQHVLRTLETEVQFLRRLVLLERPGVRGRGR